MNGCEISGPSSKWYAYKAYFENILTYSSSTKANALSYKGYSKDNAGELDALGATASSTPSANQGFQKRKAMFSDSKWVYLCINLHIDVTTMRKYIPPGVKMELDFERNPKILA